jgi:AraC-like DNA-binding protein
LIEASQRSSDWARYRKVTAEVDLLAAELETFVYERHFHDAWAVGVTLRGVQRFRSSGRTHDSTPGAVMVIPPGEVHDGESGSAGGYAYRMFYVAEPTMRAIVTDALDGATGTVPLRGAFLVDDPPLADRLRNAWCVLSADPTSLAAEESFADSMVRLWRIAPPCGSRGGGDERDPALLRVRDYMQDRLEGRVTLQELAAVASMSRFRLTRRFQSAFGLPLHAYHVQARLQEAKRRLRAGAPIATVALDLGFADQSHLHRRFKRAFAVTPGEWRRAVQ